MQPRTDDPGRDAGLITSLDNSTIRFARNLQRRRFRYREQAVLVEGTRAIRTAIEHGAELRTLLVDERQSASINADDLSVMSGVAARVLLVAGEPFDSFVDTEHPQPLAAICTMPDRELSRNADLVLALDGVRDPGNLGTLVRTAAAAAVDAVALLPGCVDQFNTRTVRASAGLVFAIPIQRVGNLTDVVESCFVERPQIAAAESDSAQSWDAVDWTRPTIIVLGGEAMGVSGEVRTYADIRVSIPMAKGVESLNVAAAGAALLFECVRQRHQVS